MFNRAWFRAAFKYLRSEINAGQDDPACKEVVETFYVVRDMMCELAAALHGDGLI